MLAGPGGARAIGERHLADILAAPKPPTRGEPITFFEITTAAAFLAFDENPADVVLLETGLGGWLDATNVVDEPLATILTPISLDHCSFLGDTIEAIAGEKAGILKRGRPAIMSRQCEKALAAIEDARASSAVSPHVANRDLGRVRTARPSHFPGRGLSSRSAFAALYGRHQFGNAGTAIAAAGWLEGLSHPDEAIVKGLITAAVWPARLERLSPGRLHDLRQRARKSGSMAATIRPPARRWRGRWPILKSAFRARFI